MREVPFDKMPEYWKEKGDDFMRILILEADGAIKKNTPVKSGRMRASWQVAEGEAVSGEKPPGRYGPSVMPPNRMNYEKEEFGKTYSIHNNLPYAEANAGRGSYPPSWGGQYRSSADNRLEEGWFDLIAKNLEDRAQELWGQMAD